MSASIFEGTAQSPAMMPSPQAYTSYVNGSRQRKDHRLRNIGLAVGAGSLLALGGYAMMNSGEVAEAAEETEEALEEEATDITSETEEEITEFAGNAEQPVLANVYSIQAFPSEDFYEILNDFTTTDGISGEEAVQIVTRMRDSGVSIPGGPISEESAWHFLTNRPEFMEGGLIPNEILYGSTGIWRSPGVSPEEFLNLAQNVPLDQRVEICFQNTLVANETGAYTFEAWQNATNNLFESIHNLGNSPEITEHLHSMGIFPDMTQAEFRVAVEMNPELLPNFNVLSWGLDPESVTSFQTEFNNYFSGHTTVTHAEWNEFLNQLNGTNPDLLRNVGLRPNLTPEYYFNWNQVWSDVLPIEGGVTGFTERGIPDPNEFFITGIPPISQ